jgi:hypothetical protein
VTAAEAAVVREVLAQPDHTVPQLRDRFSTLHCVIITATSIPASSMKESIASLDH